MVGMSTIIAVCVTLFVTLIFPFLVYIVYGVKNKGKGVWSAWLLGAAGFFVMQVIIRIPILNLLSLNSDFLAFAQNHYVLYSFVLAFTAGLFEVIGRYAVAKIMSRKLSFQRGVAAGLGHGGIEAIMLVGLTYVNNLIYIVMINTGAFDSMVEQTAALGVDTSVLIQLKEDMISSGSVMFYLAGVERLLTMALHVALSLMVCYFVWKKKDFRGILICLFLHWAADFGVVMLSGLATPYFGEVVTKELSYVFVYAYILLIAAGSCVYILRVRKQWKSEKQTV